MSIESLITDILITSYSLAPYTARTIGKDYLQGSVSLDKPLVRHNPQSDEPVTLADFIPSSTLSPEETVIQKASEEELKAIIERSRLTAPQKEAVIFRFFFDLSLKDIARAMNLSSANAANRHIDRGLKKLRRNQKIRKLLAAT